MPRGTSGRGSSAPPAPAPAPPAPAPGEPAPTAEQFTAGAALAGRWLSALDRVAAGVAHEIANALNGAVVNVEVLRLKAVPGGDAAALAPFAATAAGELEGVAALVGALTALARAPRGGAGTGGDLALAAAQLVALLAPAVRHRGVALTLDAGAARALPTAADGALVRLAVAELLLAAVDRLVELAGSHPADEPARDLRCSLVTGDVPALRLEPWPPASPRSGRDPAALDGPLDAELVALLADAGVRLDGRDGALTATFPPAGA